ncbi:hypothetical protein E4T38_06557 [Aureobasidium subglaciale]|nr:hypothetical protein E4T38_06557 [Aureobasidium subglaciale]KAI5218945.1 hypothetical protein E4T40_06676 [Aureobasidium subglaciale]KAI5222675.1 hypothetical protein E4T41_06497 [Aureobasidium subglaciale]KAI5260245.1 hypothetical protein E4T46_06209 [Aureobasidium subglaciale]
MDDYDDVEMPDFDDIGMPNFDVGDSDTSSIVSVDTPDLDSLRTYTPIDPLVLPPLTLVGNKWELTDWKEHSWRYTAQKEPTSKTFNVRQMYITNFDDTEAPDPDVFPAKYKLGPPSLRDDWNPLLDKWGMQVLNKAGFINYTPPSSEKYMDPIGHGAEERNPGDTEAERIHPVLQQDMWRNVSDDDFELLKPALLLATAILDEPETIALLRCITNDTATLPHFEDPKHGSCKLVIPVTPTDPEDMDVAFERMLQMRQWMSWQFRSVEEFKTYEAMGLTMYRYGVDGEALEAARDQAFLDAFCTFDADVSNDTDVLQDRLIMPLDIASVPNSRRLRSLDSASVMDRTNFYFAQTLIHEFAHAFSRAYSQTLAFESEPAEPWLQGNTCNELGYAVINHIFGGCPEPTRILSTSLPGYEHLMQLACPPLGMHFNRKWDLWWDNAEDGEIRVKSEKVDPKATQRVYPVPQRYVHDMGVEETWKNQVPRFGLRALHLPKCDDWAVDLP